MKLVAPVLGRASTLHRVPTVTVGLFLYVGVKAKTYRGSDGGKREGKTVLLLHTVTRKSIRINQISFRNGRLGWVAVECAR